MKTELIIDIAKQELSLFKEKELLHRYSVSTAANGAGELMGSEQTPRGWHMIHAKIGEDHPVNTVFVGRRATGEVYTPALKATHPDRDWILTRILWLSGQEIGRNRFGQVDSERRYIYIHGAPDDVPMGIPRSHGCIRMRNHDILQLFDLVSVNDRVLIRE